MFETHLASQFSGYPSQDFYGFIPGLGLPLVAAGWGTKKAYDWLSDDDDEEIPSAPQTGSAAERALYEAERSVAAAQDLHTEDALALVKKATAPPPWRQVAVVSAGALGLAAGIAILAAVLRD